MIGATRYAAAAEIQRQSKLAGEIAKLQESISTNKRLTAPSDDPGAAARIADIRQSQADHLVWSRNVDTGTSIASAADDKLVSVANVLQRAQELILAGRNDTNASVDRAAQAAELRAVAAELDVIAATSDANGRPLFPTTPPLSIPVSEGLGLTATDSSTNIFGSVTTSRGTRALSAILLSAADALGMPDNSTITFTDANGVSQTMNRGAAITSSIGEIGAAIAHITVAQTDQGIRAQRFAAAKARLASEGADLVTERSGLEDTDTVYAIGSFQSKQLALQAAQTVFAQARKTSLFDLLG